MNKLTVLLAILVILLVPDPSMPAEQTEPAQSACPSLQETGLKLGRTARFRLGDDFVAWRATQKAAPRIFINGYALDANKAQLVEISPACFGFKLSRSVMAGDLWDSLRHRENTPFLTRTMILTFGDDTGINSDLLPQEITLELISKGFFVGWVLFFAFLLTGMIRLASKSDILKDRLADGTSQNYSLAKTQMAFWFFIVSISIVFVWVITGGVEGLNASVLILMGISAATFIGASAIGTDVDTAGTASVKTANKSKKRFIIQILSDDEGVRLHRFQMAAWTVIFGIIFITQVFRDLVLPEFGGTVLGLMGISSGTYLGFKFPELKT